MPRVTLGLIINVPDNVTHIGISSDGQLKALQKIRELFVEVDNIFGDTVIDVDNWEDIIIEIPEERV